MMSDDSDFEETGCTIPKKSKTVTDLITPNKFGKSTVSAQIPNLESTTLSTKDSNSSNITNNSSRSENSDLGGKLITPSAKQNKTIILKSSSSSKPKRKLKDLVCTPGSKKITDFFNLTSSKSKSQSDSKLQLKSVSTVKLGLSKKLFVESPIETLLEVNEDSDKPPDVFEECSSQKDSLESDKDDGLNLTQLNCIIKLYEEILENDKKQVLSMGEIEIIKEFLNMTVEYQYFLMKLFVYLPKWYDLIKFCKKIKLDRKLSEDEMLCMCTFLENKYIDKDVSELDIDSLLNMLLLPELKLLYMKLKMPKIRLASKDVIIEKLKKNCRTQSTLSMGKSPDEILKKSVQQQLGRPIKLKSEIREIFYKVYLLHTYVNSFYLEPERYLSDMNYLKISYPKYNVENYNHFSSENEFNGFYRAVLLKKTMYTDEKIKPIVMKNNCDIAFERLKQISEHEKWRKDTPEFLQKYSAEYIYISLLTFGTKKLLNTYTKHVEEWLKFLIEHYSSHHKLGFWYKSLAHLYTKSQEATNFESAAKTVIEAFSLNKEKQIFDFVQINELSKLATKLRITKTFKLSSLYCQELEQLAEKTPNIDEFPKKLIKGHTDRSGNSGKRVYYYIDENDEKCFGDVEQIALRCYKNEDNYEGIHCEGRIVTCLYALFFWDIIYETYVPYTFLSAYQSAPLDFNTKYFYENRKAEIDSRLQEISEKWTEQEMEEFLKMNWENHSHENAFVKLDVITTDLDELLEMFRCFDRKVLSKIFERLVINFKTFRSGMPDLFLWNSELSKSKFVEVKGENDKLSLTQILWIKYLLEIGGDVEVCHVSGVGASNIKNEVIDVDEVSASQT